MKKMHLQEKVRMGGIFFMFMMLLCSMIMVVASYQEPTTAIENVVHYAYSQTGIFDFTVHLKNNSVYNKTIIKPDQDTIFTQIVDGINASFTYRYSGNGTIIGYYSLSATVMTELWEKNFVIVPRTGFNSESFSFDFLLNVTYYEEVVAEIDNEIGIKASDPTLVIMCSIVSSNISFSPSINVSLGGNIIEFDGDFLQSKQDIFIEERQISFQDVIDNRNLGIVFSVFSFLLLIGFIVNTEHMAIDKTERMLKKIRKRYGEFIVDVVEKPIVSGTEIVTASFEDLIKTSEALGKPVIYCLNENRHEFYVFDDSRIYKYVLYMVKKIAMCPKCSFKMILEELAGEKHLIKCPECGKKGIVFFQ